jgi:fermentation-respiration switch protein FrsA (DUF1100 family)
MTLVRAVFALLAAAALLLILVRFLEPRFAFFPLRGETTTPQAFGLPFEAPTVTTSDGERLGAWVITAPEPRAVVVYFHGNGGHLSMWAPIVCAIARRGYTVVAFDYRGYGVSSGRPTERGLYRDVDAIIEHVRTRVLSEPALPAPNPPDPTHRPHQTLIFWGRSLGVSMAAYAATRHAPAGVILESGFPEARSLFRASPPMAFLALFSTYRFPAASFMRDVKAPALVMHGDADSIIPYHQGRALYESIPGAKEFFTIKGADHNDATPPDERAYWRAVTQFIDRL